MKAKAMKVSKALPATGGDRGKNKVFKHLVGKKLPSEAATAKKAKVVCKICKGEHDTEFYDLAKLRALQDAVCEQDAVCLLCDPGELLKYYGIETIHARFVEKSTSSKSTAFQSRGEFLLRKTTR